MKETEFYQRHVKKMSGLLHLERIESSVGTGFPDVSAAGGDKQFLIETKVSKFGEGKDFLYFERFQLPFYQKRLRYTGGKGLFIVACCNGDASLLIWNAQSLLDAPREPYRKWNRIDVSTVEDALFQCSKPWTKISMQTAANIMIKNS